MMTKHVSMLTVVTLAAMLTTVGAARAQDDAPETGELEPAKELFALQAEKPGGLAFDGRLLWVTDRVAGLIRGLDPASGEQIAELSAPGPWPTGLAFDGRLLWVADKTKNRLFGIDTRARLVLREVESPSNPLGLAFDGEHLWVSDGKEIHRVMREDGTTIVSFAAPTWAGSGRKGEQLGLAFNRGSLWVSDRLADRLYRVDPEDGEVVDILAAPGPFAAGLEVVDDRLLVVDVDRRRLAAVDLGTLPRIERRDPRRQRVVLRREIVNRGPDALAEAHVYVAIPVSSPSQALDGEPTFSPAPDGIVEDQWGQRFAHFVARDLRPGKGIEV
ncbi:MAG TPA: hypothetical protein VM285_17395, partial [Polyangia bacterium]|nr:hypothetical protein [Polyangia bacterium]